MTFQTQKDRLLMVGLQVIDMDKEIKKSDVIYYARVMPTVGLYEIVELKVRTVTENYIVGIDKNTKHAFMFYFDDINRTIFFDRNV